MKLYYYLQADFYLRLSMVVSVSRMFISHLLYENEIKKGASANFMYKISNVFQNCYMKMK